MPTRADALAALTARGRRYELTDLDQHGFVSPTFVHAPPTLRALYADNRSDAEYYIYEDERITFQDAWDQAARIARVLVDDHGVSKGDRVAISMRNYPEWVTVFLAATSIGAIAVGMNALWNPDEMEYALNHVSPKVLVADGERIAHLAGVTLAHEMAVLAVRTTGGLPDGVRSLTDAIAGVTPEMPSVDLDPGDDAMILFTSGSTGYPKGVVSSHRAVISALLSWELDAAASLVEAGTLPPDVEPPEPAPGVTMLLAVPLFHVAGSHVMLLAAWRHQRRIVAMYRWDVEAAAELIEREQVAAVIAPSAITGDLVAHAQTSDRDLSSLTLVGGGGAARAPEQVRGIDKVLKAAPNIGWGMTETNAIGTGVAGPDYLSRPTSSGRCSAVLQIRTVDDEGKPTDAGARGELQIRGTSMFREYWDRPDANDESFAEDRWFRTGDVAVIDEDGWLFIVDRIKDLVIRGGENIGCGGVEAALLEHPKVHEACVYAVPDERLGEEVGATIYADADLDADELRAFLTDHLARHEIPRYLFTRTESLPRIASGKIFKRDLRATAVAELGL